MSLLPQAPEVDAVACGSFKKLDPPDIKATGYVVRSLEAVLWAFHHTSNFKDGCLKVGKGEVAKISHNHTQLCTLLRIDNVFFQHAIQRSSSVVAFVSLMVYVHYVQFLVVLLCLALYTSILVERNSARLWKDC